MIMNRHDRLMKALGEIKDICTMSGDDEQGCGNRCPFLMGEQGDYFRDCEVACFIGEQPPCKWIGGAVKNNVHDSGEDAR